MTQTSDMPSPPPKRLVIVRTDDTREETEITDDWDGNRRWLATMDDPTVKWCRQEICFDGRWHAASTMVVGAVTTRAGT
jgi:hypothetical protein